MTTRKAKPGDVDLRAIAAAHLTVTESKVATHLVQGARSREIGEKMGISHETVRTHIKRILHKTGCSRQLDFVRLVLITLRDG